MIYIFCGLRKYRKRNILKFIPVAAPAPFNKDQGFNPSTRHTEECIWKPAPRVDPSLVGKYGYRWWQNHRKVHSEATDIALQGRFWAAGIFLIRLDSLILFVRMKQIINKWQNFFSELNYFRGNKQLSLLRLFPNESPLFSFFESVGHWNAQYYGDTNGDNSFKMIFSYYQEIPKYRDFLDFFCDFNLEQLMYSLDTVLYRFTFKLGGINKYVKEKHILYVKLKNRSK